MGAVVRRASGEPRSAPKRISQHWPRHNEGVECPAHRRRFEIPGHARYLTFSCYRRLPLFQNDAIKDTFVDRLRDARARYGFRLLAWVVMPEHVHLLIVPRLPETPVPLLLRAMKQSFAQRVVRRWRELRAPILLA